VDAFQEGESMNEIMNQVNQICEQIAAMPTDDKIAALNAIRQALHAVSPFANEPVDCVLWVPSASVRANDYNPNTVAPVEMRLLELSIAEDGYTQPIVTGMVEDERETVDGYHRGAVGKTSKRVKKRTLGYLPVTTINAERLSRENRMASTIRHNRARGKHQVEAMSSIVTELVRRGWDNEKIANELGMDADEVLRLKQITGLAEMFADREFSEAWKIEEVTNEHS
jgi:ParB-like chromosome segregation protein Spo0J